MNANGLVAYPAHVFLLKVSHSYRKLNLKKFWTQVVLIPVYFMDGEDDVRIVYYLLSTKNINFVPLQYNVRLTY